MEVMALDTETTGLCCKPKLFNAFYPYHITKYYDSSRVIQVGCVLYKGDGSVSLSKEWLVRPDGFRIENSHIHGITMERATAEGQPFEEVAREFGEALARARLVVVHNVNFDKNVLCAELYRAGFTDLARELCNKAFFCTMANGKDLTRIPTPYGYKYPTLKELYECLFHEDFVGAHTALCDAQACGRCYFKIIQSQAHPSEDAVFDPKRDN